MNVIRERINKIEKKFVETPSKEIEHVVNEQYKEFLNDGTTDFVKYYQNITNPKKEVKKTVDMSAVDNFLDKYETASPIIQVLRKDLMAILSDMHWIKESGNQNEQFSLDFADALNSISVSI